MEIPTPTTAAPVAPVAQPETEVCPVLFCFFQFESALAAYKYSIFGRVRIPVRGHTEESLSLLAEREIWYRMYSVSCLSSVAVVPVMVAEIRSALVDLRHRLVLIAFSSA